MKAQRMIQGACKHGPLNLSTDSRNFVQEAIEEVIDCLNYIQFAFEKGQLNRVSYQKIDKVLRDAATMLLSGQA
jgi:hypothetical protein